MPPNGWGCKCWVKQLTKRQANKILESQKQAIESGDMIPFEWETEKYTNPKTGEVVNVPKGIDLSFNHNFDRLTALVKLAEDKHSTAFGERLKAQIDEFILDLIFQPDFTRGVKTVLDDDFKQRFGELNTAVKSANGNRDNSMQLRKDLAKGEFWAVATIAPNVQEKLGSETAIVWLSDDTMIKMIAHHAELDLFELFKNTAYILKNAVKVVQKDDFNLIYFSVQENNYISTVKATKDKSELFLTTIYQARDKEFQKMLNK